MQRQIVRIGSTNVVELRRLKDETDDLYQEGAAVDCDIVTDPGDTPIATDIPMAQVVGNTGEDVLYRGEISAGVAFVEGNYKAVIKAIAVSGKVRLFPVYLSAVE